MQNHSSILPRSSIDDIDITNDIMFSYVMSQNDICLKMISCLLPDIKIDRIEYTGTSSPIVQKTIPGPLEKRGVRLDVFLDDGTTVIDVEMHSSTLS
ncbi:MAG: hypothetical protein GXZ16_04825 [Spirochaetales bacterium]|nr:hypothetical protein [Spirochaetales bacterium]